MPCSKCGGEGHNVKTCKGRRKPTPRCALPTFDKQECIICLETIGTGSSTTVCGHRFCTQCLVKHLRISNKCPYCRTVLCEPVKKISEQTIIGGCLANEELRHYLLANLKSQIVAGMQKYGVCGIEDILDIISKEVDLEHSITVVAEDVLHMVATYS